MTDDLWAVRLVDGSLLGGLLVLGCQHIGNGAPDLRCNIQTMEAKAPESGVFFGVRKNAQAVANLCPEGAEVVKVEPRSKVVQSEADHE